MKPERSKICRWRPKITDSVSSSPGLSLKVKVKSSRSVVSDSSRPHGLQPTRLLRPWDFPGKSTGVGCHCLLRHISYSEENLDMGGSLSISIVFCRIILIAGWYCNLKFHPQASVPRPPVDSVATQWHKRISNDFSLELEGRIASSYQGCISKASAGKWIGYFPS